MELGFFDRYVSWAKIVNPPFVQTIAGYFQEKHMPKSKAANEKKVDKELDHQRIRDKLLAEIALMEQAERELIKNKQRRSWGIFIFILSIYIQYQFI